MKTIFWILAVGALALVGYAALNQKPAQAPVPVVQNSSETPEGGKKMSFAAFLEYDKTPHRCTVDQYLSDMDQDGVVYIDNGKIRGDFTTIAEGRPLKVSFLTKDGYQYIWQAGMTTGVKLSVNTASSGDVDATAQGTYSWNANQIGEYNCEPWAADEATFALPQGITFVDAGTMVKSR